jgi:hypothetical protein
MEIAGAVTSRYRSNQRGSAHHRDLFYAAFFCAEDRAFVVESGRAGERNIRDGSSNFGATLVVEATPIEEWLELGFGVTALVNSDRREARLTGSKRFWTSCSGAAISLNGGLLVGWHRAEYH